MCDDAGQSVPAYTLYVQRAPGQRTIGKAWLLSLAGDWFEVADGDVHPAYGNRRLSLLGETGKPSWILKDSWEKMRHLKEKGKQTISELVI